MVIGLLLLVMQFEDAFITLKSFKCSPVYSRGTQEISNSFITPTLCTTFFYQRTTCVGSRKHYNY